MNLDANTLFLVTIYVEVILGLLLLFALVQNAEIPAIGWWGCAHLMRAAAVVLFGTLGSFPDIIATDLAHAILLLAYGVTWTGARVFDGRKPLPLWLVAGPVIWLAAVHLPVLNGVADIGFFLACCIIAIYTWMSGYEFWRGRGEPLLSRWPAIFMSCAYGALFLLCSPVAAMLSWGPLGQTFESVWLLVLSFEALLFSIAIAFIMLAMAKERTEYRHKIAAMIDPLTGIANRRSFLLEAEKLKTRQGASARSMAVLVIDLDQFKSINDQFGHAVGDSVLQAFAKTATATLRRTDLFGRIGGEEFAAVLYDVGSGAALDMAEQIRRSFAEAATVVDGHKVGATVSIGLVADHGAALDLPELLAQADSALYRAKERGRNRVEVAALDQQRKRKSTIVSSAVAQARSAA